MMSPIFLRMMVSRMSLVTSMIRAEVATRAASSLNPVTKGMNFHCNKKSSCYQGDHDRLLDVGDDNSSLSVVEDGIGVWELQGPGRRSGTLKEDPLGLLGGGLATLMDAS